PAPPAPPEAPVPAITLGEPDHHLTPADPVVADHVVAGQPTLPAAGHLSMLYRSMVAKGDWQPVTVSRAVWLRPFLVNHALVARVRLAPTGNDTHSFQITGLDADGATQVFSKGQVRIGADDPEPVDLAAVRARCGNYASVPEHYARFDRMGVRYGPQFRTVTAISAGDGEGVVTRSVDGARSDIPAGMLDGAVQAVGAVQAEENGAGPHLPFSMAAVRILRPIPAVCWAHVVEVADKEYDVTIVDDDGQVCIDIESLVCRELQEP